MELQPMPELDPVGIAGVGLMGEVCARRLIAAGFSVIGFDECDWSEHAGCYAYLDRPPDHRRSTLQRAGECRPRHHVHRC